MPGKNLSRRDVVAGLLALPLGARAVSAQTGAGGPRPAEWARPVGVKGAPNLHQVGKNFFRSAQPNAEGFRTLATEHGVRTVVSLRAFNADRRYVRGLDLHLIRYKIHTWNIEREDVVGALRSVRTAMRDAPVLLHCQHGADRTGLVSALYRIVYEDWSKQAALEEMLKGNFGYHAVWGNIPKFIRRVDVARLRQEIGVP